MPLRQESGDPVTLSDCGSSGPARIPADMAPPAAALRRGGCRSRMAIMPRRQGVPFSTQPGRQTPIKDATMRKIVAGLAISLGGVAESPADW